MSKPTSNKEGAMLTAVSIIVATIMSTCSYQLGEPERAESARLTSFVVAPEAIRISTQNSSLELTPIPETVETRSGYHPSWAVLRTDSWIILPNAEEGKALCPQVLADFIGAQIAQDKRRSWQLRNIDALLLSHKNTSVDLNVFVPRPEQAPKGLASCPSVGYDTDRKLLTFEGRPIAVLAKKQSITVAPVMPPRTVPRLTY